MLQIALGILLFFVIIAVIDRIKNGKYCGEDGSTLKRSTDE